MSGTPKYRISPKLIFFGSAIILFLNVEFTDSASNMSKTVQKLTRNSSKFSMNSYYCRPYWNRHFLFLIDLFSGQIRNQHPQKPTIEGPDRITTSEREPGRLASESMQSPLSAERTFPIKKTLTKSSESAKVQVNFGEIKRFQPPL